MKLFKKIFSIILAGAFVLGTSIFSTSTSDKEKYEVENVSLISNEMGGGGAPSIDEPDGEKLKVFPQPEVQDVIIPDEDKVSWVDALNDYINEQVALDSTYQYTLIGSGTERDPYQISNAYDFAYCAKTSFAKGTYFELTDDIVLNDGYFEEDGTYHDAGDGKLYEWKPNTTFVKKYFDGKNHEIIGLYKNSLFAIAREGGIYKNFYVKKAYVNNFNGIVFGRNSSSESSGHEFCNISCDGYITSEKMNIGGLCGTYCSGTIIKNCVNYAKVFSSSKSCFGIATGNGVSVINCCNYENIVGISVGGLIGAIYNTTIENCTNYGKLESVSSSGAVGGIVSNTYGENKIKFINCVNKGEINTKSWGGTAGIMGQNYNGEISFINCINEGKINSTVPYAAGILGYAHGPNLKVDLFYCVNKADIFNSSYYAAGIYACQNDAHACCNIIACENYGNITGSDLAAGIFNGSGTANISNCYSSGVIKSNLRMNGISLGGLCKNCFCEGEIKSSTNAGHTNAITNTSGNIENCVFNGKFNGNDRKYFYGTDFSAFFVKWKTGYIGLKALESAGVYMFAIPNETYLQERGFVKAG